MSGPTELAFPADALTANWPNYAAGECEECVGFGLSGIAPDEIPALCRTCGGSGFGMVSVSEAEAAIAIVEQAVREWLDGDASGLASIPMSEVREQQPG